MVGCGGGQIGCGDTTENPPCLEPGDFEVTGDFGPIIPPEECIEYLDEQGNPVVDKECFMHSMGIFTFNDNGDPE